MAKKTRRDKGDKAESVKASDMMLMPPSTTIRSLRTERAKALKTSRNATSIYGQQVSEAVEKKHVDKKALSMAMSLEDMPPERLAITLPHLLRYIDDLGLDKRATEQAELFEQQAKEKAEGGEGEEGDDAGEGGEGKVTRIGRAARKVMEQAGANPPAD